jgi:AcrR family transcriptional regulator
MSNSTLEADPRERNPSYHAILQAARALFVGQGFPDTSMELIARHANVVRATVYNNFADKEAILAEIMRRYLAGYAEISTRLRERARAEQNSFALIEQTVREAIMWRIENAELLPLIDLSQQLPNSRWQETRSSAAQSMADWVRSIHERDAERGLIRPELELELASTRLYAMIESTVYAVDVSADRRTIDAAVRQMTIRHWQAFYRTDPPLATAASGS